MMVEGESIVDEDEMRRLAKRWGEPTREQVYLPIRAEFWEAWGDTWPGGKHREVMFLLPRPGGLLLHRKARYPLEGWRLLTGGVNAGESIHAALAREILEEVGLTLGVRRYVALLTCELEEQGRRYHCATHIFLMEWSDLPLQPSYEDEIEATRTIPLRALAAVADQLERLNSPWEDWGRFRALAHRLVAAKVSPEELEPGR